MINYYDFILMMCFQQQCANAKYTMRFYNNYTIQLGSWTEINNPWGVDLLDKFASILCESLQGNHKNLYVCKLDISNKLTQNTK